MAYLDWLNRVGLLVGLISTILLSPELIGLDRIKNWQKEFITFLHHLKEMSSYYNRTLAKIIRQNRRIKNTAFSIITIESITLIQIYFNPLSKNEFQSLRVLVFTGIILFSIYAGIKTANIFPSPKKYWNYAKWIAIYIFCITFVLPLAILFVLFYTTALLLMDFLFFISAIAERTLKKLEGEWLRSRITTTGIIMLFASFLLQLLATFK